MTKAITSVFACLLLLSTPAPLLADLTLNNVSAAYFVVDSDSNQTITVQVQNPYKPGMLQYDSGAGWTSLGKNTSTFAVYVADHQQLVQFRLALDGGGYDTVANLFFAKEGSEQNLYRRVNIDFDGSNNKIDVNFKTPGEGNVAHFTPAPLPNSIWLFAAGLLGLVGVRRRILK
jgi:hypothetical protein